MNKKQYNNIIDHTLKHEDTEDSLSTARAVFKNMGVALPGGDMKEVFETVKTDNYMGWKPCTMEEAQAAANKRTAAIGISDSKIVVLAADDAEEPIEPTAEVLTITDSTPAVAVAGLQYYSYSYGGCCNSGGCCGDNIDIGDYNDRYTYELVNTFGFSKTVANLIRSLYDKVDNKFCSETRLQKAWKCARVLSEFVYDNDSTINKWDDVAGSVTNVNNRRAYFVDTLGYTNYQYAILNQDLIRQHSTANTKNSVIDFCHMQYSLSARLAYSLGYDSFISNWGTGFVTGNWGYYTDEDISYLAGWFGDAILMGESGGTTSFGNDDYMSDLDAENIYRIILQGGSSVNAFSNYYATLSSCKNRAHIFKGHISYESVRSKIFYELVDTRLIELINANTNNIDLVKYYRNLLKDEEYHWNVIRTQYYDTYNFLKSLNDNRSNLINY